MDINDSEYEPDGECECSKSGVEPEWEWNEKQHCWVCSGCGSIC